MPHDQRARRLIGRLRAAGPSRTLLRGLQRYTVGLYEEAFRTMVQAGDIEVIEGEFAILINRDTYDPKLGVRPDRPGYWEPETLVL